MCFTKFCYAMIFFFARKIVKLFYQHNTIMIKVHVNPQQHNCGRR